MSLFLVLSFCTSYEVFKKCNDMRFCHHNIDQVGEWSLSNPSFDYNNNEFTGNLFNHNNDDNLKLIIYLMQNNSFRVRFLPTNQENFTRYKLYENSYVVNQDIINQRLPLTYSTTAGNPVLSSSCCEAEVNLSPFYVKISDKFDSKIYINYNQNLVFEHKGEKVPPDYWPYYMNDTIKNGATATGVDFSFTGKNTRITGFAEADDSMNFEDTKDEPRRASNLDFYSDYGHIPLVYGHSPSEMISFFWLNPTDTFFKITTDNINDLRNIRVLSEGGYADIIVFTGNLFTILESYTNLTGHHEIPPIFSLGYHQSKWGYKNQSQVEQVIDELDNRKFPLDVFWLDVDHLHGHEPFRFDRTTFPNPSSLFEKLSGRNRYLVRLNDPHLPEDDTHSIYKYAKEHGYFVNQSDGKTPFNAICWPGSSFWPDFLNPTVHQWWSTLYKYEENETAPNVYFWNDMNEPSVFSVVEGTFPKENVYFDGYEEREIRNIYGLLMHSATHDGVVNRNDDRNTRPFILTRSFFAGSQKYTWMWSGDNTANYDHLKRSIPMAVVAGLCGMPLTGSDLGGFNGDPTPQLISRWYQAGAYSYALFRNHCHEDSPHREPYLYDDDTFAILREATRSRYEISPLMYTSAHHSHLTGVPPILPLFALFPEVDSLHDVDDHFVLGQSLLVAPVVEEDAKVRSIVKPPGIWYNFTNGQKLTSSTTIDVTNGSLPLFIRGGTIIPMFSRVGMTMEETRKGPLKLLVGCDEEGTARGPLYVDDGISFNYEKGEFMNRWIVYENNKIRIERRQPFEEKLPSIADRTFINEIVFFGLKEKPEMIGQRSLLVCNEEGDTCTMKEFMLYPKNITPSDDDDNDGKMDKKTFYIIVGSAAGGLLVLVVVIVLSVFLCRRNKEKKIIDDDKKNIESILNDSQKEEN
ncbi:hypothetical protein M9Y10_035695 [Tritrichomonas musculus]|uniref:Glucosidase II subunit alpha n=1 Tax=Tritrichomonas musculus TaxID=1915356 RepID=A0ABR2GWI5_9EUKA